MHAWIENVYHQSPLSIQNTLVTLYGLKLRRERYGKESSHFLRALRQSERFTEDQHREYQERQFVRLARHSIETVPYYRSWAKREGALSEDIKRLSDLRHFPIVDKATLKSRANDFVSDSYVQKRLVRLETSGTSGSPVPVFCDSQVRTHHYAFFSRLREWFGVNRGARRATLFGRIIMPPDRNRSPFWRWDFANNNLLMSSYHLSESNLPDYYEQLRKAAPDEIIGYPSSLYQIANFIQKRGLAPLKVKVVFATAETLFPYQREAIEKAFRAPLINQYGCTEMAFFASQCEHGVMHFHPEHGITEVVRGDGEEYAGAEGSLVVTGLLNPVMPLIRYDIGDVVELGPEGTCSCGRSFPRIARLIGRVDDTVYKKDGTPIGRLDPVFKGGSNISEAQVIQKTDGSIEVRVVPEADFGVENKKWIENELTKRVGNDVPVVVSEVEQIERGANGKFRAVISHYKP